MSYVSSTIGRVIDDINRTYFLPAIQRPYVWESDQIISLFDSLLKGYPISSFLFWDVRPEKRADWEIYKFVENFRHGDTHNEITEPDGRDVVLVLDGQQRLTSLLIGLRGTFAARPKYARRQNPESWSRQKLYIDLLKDPSSEGGAADDEFGLSYGLSFYDAEPKKSADRLWMKVGRILDCTSDDKLDQLADELLGQLPPETPRSMRRTAERVLDRLYRTIWKDEVISYYTEKDQSYDRVLNIFIRANDGGTKLSKSDLLLSMITSNWHGVSARQEIYDFVDYLNEGLESKNEIDKDFVMKSCLLLTDLDHRYKVSNFTTSNLASIERNWKKIKLALESTLRLVNRLGIDAQCLTSVNALMPIAYYLFRLDKGSLNGSTPFEAENVRQIHRWLLSSLLNGVFGGSSDQTIGSARSVINEAFKTGLEFPRQGLVRGLASRGRFSGFKDDEAIDQVLDIGYGKKNCFLALSLMYDTANWGGMKFHIDHIIPRALSQRDNLMRMNLPASRIKLIMEAANRIGNLEILLARENLEKSASEFKHWMETRDKDFLNNHLIPDDPDLWHVEALPEFVKAREKLIRQRLRIFHIDPASMGGAPVT